MPRNRRDELLAAEHELLAVKLRPDEVLQRGEVLATLLGRLEELSLEEKALKDTFKRRRETLETEVSDLSRVVRSKAEERAVLVETVGDFERGVAVSIRTDTGEVIRERDLTAAERQPALFKLPRRPVTEEEATHT